MANVLPTQARPSHTDKADLPRRARSGWGLSRRYEGSGLIRKCDSPFPHKRGGNCRRRREYQALHLTGNTWAFNLAAGLRPDRYIVHGHIVPNFIHSQKAVIHKTPGSRGRISRVHPAHPPILESCATQAEE